MQWQTWLLIIVLVALLIFLIWLLLKFIRESKKGAGGGGESRNGDSAYAEEMERRRQEEQRQKLRKATQIVSVPTLANAAARLMELPPGMQADQIVRRLVERASIEQLDILQLSGQQGEIQIDLQKNVIRVPVEYPTRDIEPTAMIDINQMPSLMLEELVLDDDQFMARLACGETRIMQAYNSVQSRKLLYILLDTSASMNDEIGHRKIPRHVWARGVTVNLLLQALRGDAKYYFRAFTNGTSRLFTVDTSEEAEQMVVTILTKIAIDGGTNVMHALKIAIADIREAKVDGEIAQSEILLITDAEAGNQGDSRTIDDPEKLRKLMGDDIQLHVALIGAESASLQQVAASYQVFN